MENSDSNLEQTAQNTNIGTSFEQAKKISHVRKYLIFILNGSYYGVPLSEVKEVIGLPQCIPVPSSPPYLLGLINLRGRVISAIDLKGKLGISSGGQTVKRPAVILTECDSIILGCVVDSISEVLAIDENNIDRSMEVQVVGEQEYVQGIARFANKPMILLLNLKKAADISKLVRLKNHKQAC